MPFDPAPSPFGRPATRLARFFGRFFQGTPSGGSLGAFQLRSELALLKNSVARLNSEFGRRDVKSVKDLVGTVTRRDFEAAVRERIHTVPLPDGTVLCRILGRYKMYVDAADHAVAPHLMLEGYWQYWVTAFICRNLNRGETAYDLEAGYGYYTLLLSELVGPEGRVVALEFNPWLHTLLRRNLALNGRDSQVVCHRLVAAKQAVAALEMPASLLGPVQAPNAAIFQRRGSQRSCVAPAMTLDGLEPDSADFIHISATLLEQGVLEGMAGLIQRSPSLRILLEFDAKRCRDPEKTLALLEARYPLRFIDSDSYAKPISREAILAGPTLTLFLSKLEPA